jgi:hypothetical protein
LLSIQELVKPGLRWKSRQFLAYKKAWPAVGVMNLLQLSSHKLLPPMLRLTFMEIAFMWQQATCNFVHVPLLLSKSMMTTHGCHPQPRPSAIAHTSACRKLDTNHASVNSAGPMACGW